MGRRRGSGKIGGGSKEAGARKVSSMDKGVWEEAVREDADEVGVGSCDRRKGGVYSAERKGVSIVKRRERRGEGVCKGAIKEGIYPAIQVTTNGTGILCREERWEEEDGTGLSVS